MTASTGPRAPARSTLKLAIGLLVLGGWILLPARSASADCSILDLTCVTQTVEQVVQTTSQTAGSVVQTVEQTVEETVGGVDETVEQTVGGVEETVEETVGGVEEVLEDVDETVGGVIDPVEDTIDEGAGVVGDVLGPDVPGRDAGGVGGGPPGGPDRVGPREVVGASPVPSGASAGLAPPVAVSSGDGTAGREIGPEQIGRSLGPAELLAFPLTLAAIVGGFLVGQMWLDRRDPKLALAPVGADVLPFA